MSALRTRSLQHLLIAGALLLPLAACSNSGTKDTMQDTPSTQAADNTGRNAADTSGAVMTPMDQGESDLDRGITQAIRQIVVGDGTLSTNAHNIKIITVNGKVTLRGPVDSQDEANRLFKLAEGVAGVNSVDSRLEVVPR